MDLLKSFLLFSISSLSLHFLVKRYRRGLLLPPGPKGTFVIGNIYQVLALAKSDDPPWVTYSNWSHIYGNIFTFHVLGSRTVVLNSYKAIVELLEQRSYNYSDRPFQPMANELVRWKWVFSLMPYSDWWRLHRRTFHQSFQTRVVPEYYHVQKEGASLLIQNLATSPKDFFEHVRAYAGGTILEIVYGYRNQTDIASYVKLVDVAMVGLNASGVHGSYLVDFFPILKHVPAWFPGAGFKTKAEVWARDTDRLVDLPWVLVKKLMDEGAAVPCFCTRNLEKYPNSMDEVIKNCAGAAFLGAGETTVSAVLSFILAMVLNPQIQVRAQKELDEITGSTRLPDFADRPNLPYIDAILAETLRWNPVAPLAIPHRAINDDIYEGFLIPGGSTVIANAWAVLRDESLYGPDTANFNPDRFIKQDGKYVPPNPELIAFGFGRRVCPGRSFAINSLWLAMTYLLANFTIAKEVDSEGKEIDPPVEYLVGIASQPCPFNSQFIPRPSAPLVNQ